MNSSSEKVKYFFLALTPLVILLLLQTIVTFMCMSMAAAMDVHEYAKYGMSRVYSEILDTAQNTDFLTTVEILYALAGSAAFLVIYRKFVFPVRAVPDGAKQYPATPLGAGPTLSFRGIHVIFLISGLALIAFSLQYLSNYIVAFVASISPDSLRYYNDLMKTSGLDSDHMSTGLIIYAVILGPVTEELAFRGVTQGFAGRALPFWGANILQAVLFGAMHMNLIQMSYAFVIGMVLGYVYHRTGNILISIALHMGFNAISVFLAGLLPVPSQNPVVFGVVLLAALCICYGGMLLVKHAASGRAAAGTETR